MGVEVDSAVGVLVPRGRAESVDDSLGVAVPDGVLVEVAGAVGFREA